MLNPLKKKKNEELDNEIKNAIAQMSKFAVDSEEYGRAALNVKTLMEAKAMQSKGEINADTLLAVGANLLGILLILNHERLNIITTKAISFLPRGRM